MIENWRNVPGHDSYQVSIDTKEGKCRNIDYGGKIRELKNTIEPVNGRIYWHLYKNRKRTAYQAARWIALTYPELVQNEYFEGAEIDHIDGDRLNNQPSNLRWVTKKENQNNPITKVNMSKAQRNRPDQSKEVQQYTKEGDLVSEYVSAGEASRKTGIAITNISSCCLGKSYMDKNGHTHTIKSAGGYVWKYKG